MESLSGPARGGEGTGPSQDGGEDQVYPVNSSCPSTSMALSIPEIREKIVDLAVSPRTMSSFCKVREVGRVWQDTAFELMKDLNSWSDLNSDLGRLEFRLDSDVDKIRGFLEKVTPNARLPLVLSINNINNLDVPLANQLADYSHSIVGLKIFSHEEGSSNLDTKLEVFQGRHLCCLQTVELNVDVFHPVEETQKGLDAIERLTGSVTKLTKFEVFLKCRSALEDELVLPSRVTELFLYDCYSLQAVLHRRNTFPKLKDLYVHLKKNELEPHAYLHVFLERTLKLEYLGIAGDVPPLNEAPLPLPLPQLNSLKQIFLKGVNYAVETTETRSGSDVLPNLTCASLQIVLNLEERELDRLKVLGRLLRNATNFRLSLKTSQIALPIMEHLSECFSNVTKLYWRRESTWEDFVLPLSHVFLRMTSLQKLSFVVFQARLEERPVDLCLLLTGRQESEMSEEEKATLLNGRRDVVTNLCRLRRLMIRTENEFQPLSPFLFEAVFNSMPELTKIRLSSRLWFPADPFINVQEAVTTWRASGKKFTHRFELEYYERGEDSDDDERDDDLDNPDGEQFAINAQPDEDSGPDD